MSPMALRLVRQPGRWGPTLRCSGELSVATAEALRRELALLAPMARPALILNLSGCLFVDAEGVSVILQAFEQWRREGRQIILVAVAEGPLRLLHTLEIDRTIPMFPSEEAAAQALQEHGPAGLAPTAEDGA